MTSMNRRTVLTTALAGLAAPLLSIRDGSAADYPNKFIRLVFPYNAGGAPDVHARHFADMMSKQLGVNVIVDGRPGAGGRIGATLAARAPADGYTLLWAAGSLFGTNPFLFSKLEYALDDFDPIGVFSEVGFAFVAGKHLDVKTLPELLERARREPEKLNYANPSIGNQMHLTWERLAQLTGAEVTRVTYKGNAPMLTALLQGESDFTCAILSGEVLGAFKTGAVVPLAVTSDKRHPDIPDTPTMAEAGFPNFTAYGTYQAFVPKGVPAPVMAKLVDALRAGKRTPQTIDSLRKITASPSPVDGPAETLKWLKEDQEVWRSIIAHTKIRLD